MTELPNTFPIAKVTGTHADVFATVGLADLLAEGTDGEIEIVDGTTQYEVQVKCSMEPSFLARISQRPGYPYLLLPGQSPPEGAGDVVDYGLEKERADRRREQRRARAPSQAMDRELERGDEPRGDWRLIQLLRVLQGHETSNKVYRQIVGVDEEAFRQDLRKGLEAIVLGKQSEVDWEASLVQIFNPHAPKGYARLKPDSTDRNDKTKEHWADPFVEWLKYRGYFRVAWGYFHGPDGEHVRIICPVPSRVTLSNLEAVMRGLRKSPPFGCAPKQDVLSVLKIAELLVRHSEHYGVDEELYPGLLLKGQTPADVISGIMVTNYQSLGQARAVTEMMSLALPDWFPVATQEDAKQWLEILDEHQRIIKGLRDDRSDEIDLLLYYRQSLQVRGDARLNMLLEFVGRYGSFWMRSYGNDRWPKRFTNNLLRRVVMSTSTVCSKILQDPGFRAVASAVRRSTVSAQVLKAMGLDHRDIRYELLHEIRRTRNLPGGALVEAVAEFVSLYNAENARIREVKKDLRAAPPNVTTDEFAAFCRLVEDYGAPLVGALLCAFGSCREAREDEAIEERQDVLQESESTEA